MPVPTISMTKEFARILQKIRAEHQYRQEDLAKRIGAFREVVSGWESGRRNPSRRYLERLAQRFPEYSSELFVSARMLHRQLDYELKSNLVMTLERYRTSNTSST